MYSTTQDQENLLNKVIEGLKERGAKLHHFMNAGSIGVMIMDDNDYEKRPYERYGFKGYDIYGITYHVQETYRSNGTNENKSVYISVIKWEQSTGHQIERIKISQNDGAKRFNNLLNKIVEAYIKSK